MAPALDRVEVEVEITAEVTTPGRIALCLAVAGHLGAQDALVATGPAGVVPVTPVALSHGTRVHLVDVPLGRLHVRYSGVVGRGGPGAALSPEVTDADRLTFVLPSRYCPSDRLAGWAEREFGSRADDRVRALRAAEWVHERTEYVPGSTGPGDDALVPLLTGRGVCRDYAHLLVAVLRALEIPARYVSVYAPGLSPMDSHAVAEVAVDDAWWVLDATRLAPRRSMVRAGTGRDACDAALMTTLGAQTDLPSVRVLALAQPDLPDEDPGEWVALR
ncbi:transglutaminase-like domain-containing protein [Phycicoccus flavus]|uniref:Transglutaminase family protein n=1 Tax=Phycicoccus flavus TaxID=2502783 RepID=A0A8T6QXQ3_9MICO|nr:transglutaminase family protein [Phycicoccus flavus]NHA66599.1 transglutaminase family protein [Phycicoccus flavus]